ncbi:MAG TPA: hypothetical protein VMU32_07070 [Solirubrobacteraceae bacterium]|nr:hypothetical protein [Solirubrobacteraceae bacterium]
MRRSTTRLLVALAAALAVSAAFALTAWAHAPKAPPAPRPPHASTGGASHASETSVALIGAVNPRGVETTCYFQYGTTTAYGAQTAAIAAGSGTTSVKIDQPLTGLQPGTTYHYRLIATSASGTGEGQDRTFTTKQTPLRFVIAKAATTQVFGRKLTLAGTLTGSGAAAHQVIAQSNPFPYLGTFGDIGTASATNGEGAFSLTLPSFTQTTEVRVRTLDPLPVYSKVLTVHVAARVTLRARPTRTPGVVRLSGSVFPAENGAPVLFQRVTAGRASLTVASTTAKRAGAYGSVFAATVKIRRGGGYRALVKLSSGRQVSGTSSTVNLRGAPPHRARRPRPRRRR